jgi:hypothetical protein
MNPPPRLSPAPAKLPPPAAPPKPTPPTPRPAAGINPFLDEAGLTPSSRTKKHKPPPAVISAGGVDMARAHASNVQPKANLDPKTVDVPKVVVAVETDPRRVRTGPRMAHSGVAPDSAKSPAEKTLESARPPAVIEASAGPSPWANAGAEVLDKKALPSSNLPISEPAPEAEPRRKGTPLWLRLAAVATLLLLAFAVVRRFVLLPSARSGSFGPVSSSVGTAPPLPDEPAPTSSESPGASAAPEPALAAAPPPPSPTDSAAAAEAPPDPSATPETTTEPIPATARPRTAAPPPPKPTFKPLFELPHEKSKE